MSLSVSGLLKGPQDRGWRLVANVVASRGRKRFTEALEEISESKEEGSEMTDKDYDAARQVATAAAHSSWERAQERSEEEEAEQEDIGWTEGTSRKAHQRAPQSPKGIVPLTGEGSDQEESPDQKGDQRARQSPKGIVPNGEVSDLSAPEGNVVPNGEVSIERVTEGLDGVWIEEPQVVAGQDTRPVVPITIRICADDEPVQCFARIDLGVPDPCAELRARLAAFAGFELAEITFLTSVRPAISTKTLKPKRDRKTGEPVMIDSPYHVEARARDRATKSWPPAGKSTVTVRQKVGDNDASPWIHLRDPVDHEGDGRKPKKGKGGRKE